MELIEKIKQALCDNSPFDDDKPDDYEGEAQAILTALIEHASGDRVTDADENAAWETGIRLAKDDWLKLFQAFARHRATAFAAGKAAREREIVAWLRNRKEMTDRYIDYIETAQAADCIEDGEV